MNRVPSNPDEWAELKRQNEARGRSLKEDASEVVGLVFGLVVIGFLLAGAAWLAPMVGEWLAFEPTWQWWLGAYLIVGLFVASISSLVIFAVSWWWSADTWGAFCFVFGWLPAGILAAIAWPLIVFLWGPALLAWSVLLDLRRG